MRLTDCFMDLIAYVVYFQKTVGTKQPPYEKVKADISRLLAGSEGCLKKGGFSQEDYDQARFMICAWVDEVILGSSWNYKAHWQREQLQRVHYHTTDAGEEVFERLNTIGIHQRDVREVYYLCMALGFAGRYCHKGDEVLLDQVKTSNLKLLVGSTVGLPSLERQELFPEAYPAESPSRGWRKRRFRFSIVTLVCLFGPVILLGVLYLIYRFTLSGIGENILRAVL